MLQGFLGKLPGGMQGETKRYTPEEKDPHKNWFKRQAGRERGSLG